MPIKQQIKIMASNNKRLEVLLKERRDALKTKRELLKQELEQKKKGEGLNKNIEKIKLRQERAIKIKEQEFLNLANKAGAHKRKKK